MYNHCTEGGKYEGRCTAPLLVDLESGRIISNESGDIVRMLNAFPKGVGNGVDLCPPALLADIDAINAWVYEQLNNGVYRCGFATKQGAYERAERDVHAGLARVDELLQGRRFLCGATLTEADVRLLPTAARFDGCYASFFRCGRRQVRAWPRPFACRGPLWHRAAVPRRAPAPWPRRTSRRRLRPLLLLAQIRSDYPAVRRWLREMLELTGPGLFDLDEARRSYYTNLFPLNPGGIVPAGPSPADLGFPEGAAKADADAFTYHESA